jgi:hypothetical protein
MKANFLFTTLLMIVLLPFLASGQNDTTAIKKDTLAHVIADTLPAKKVDTLVVQTPPAPPSCYQEWSDAFAQRGARPVTDGMQDVVIAFKNGENYHCYMGRVEVVGGKIKAPLYVQTENGEYKTFASMGKKLDPEFVAASGDQLWKITDGMSVLLKTVDNEYGRLFFYKFVSKGAQSNKQAPSPSELIKD